MIEITNRFIKESKFRSCPDCGGTDIHLYDDFTWHCRECGWVFADCPCEYLSMEELIDWKAGMWEPRVKKTTSLMLGWQLMENGKEIEGDVIDFDTAEDSLKYWLTRHLIDKKGLGDCRELRFFLYDLKELEDRL